MSRVMSKSLSRILHSYRFQTPYFRGKARTFRWFRQLIRYPRMVIPYDNGGWIAVNDQGEYIEKVIWAEGTYEPEVWATLQSFASKSEVLWDIGANIGSVSICALLDKRFVEVHCFEPNPAICEVLQLN